MKVTKTHAKDIINDLDSPREGIRLRGSQKLALLEAQLREDVDVVDLQRIAKSQWQPGTTQAASTIFLCLYLISAVVFFAYLAIVKLTGSSMANVP